MDIRAVQERDPAARSWLEVLLLYQGVHALIWHRFAHWFYRHRLFFIARLISQIARFFTLIEIHPGAELGHGILIDHGSGVIIGETAVIGDNVRIYQGVTLGAGNFPKDACGMLIKGNKRHPTIGNNVTIYSGASVLGDIKIGDNSVIGGNVWLTESLPPGTKITSRPPENKLKFANGQG